MNHQCFIGGFEPQGMLNARGRCHVYLDNILSQCHALSPSLLQQPNGAGSFVLLAAACGGSNQPTPQYKLRINRPLDISWMWISAWHRTAGQQVLCLENTPWCCSRGGRLVALLKFNLKPEKMINSTNFHPLGTALQRDCHAQWHSGSPFFAELKFLLAAPSAPTCFQGYQA